MAHKIDQSQCAYYVRDIIIKSNLQFPRINSISSPSCANETHSSNFPQHLSRISSSNILCGNIMSAVLFKLTFRYYCNTCGSLNVFCHLRSFLWNRVKFTLLLITYFSTIEICLYSLYRKRHLLDSEKEKILIGHCAHL